MWFTRRVFLNVRRWQSSSACFVSCVESYSWILYLISYGLNALHEHLPQRTLKAAIHWTLAATCPPTLRQVQHFWTAFSGKEYGQANLPGPRSQLPSPKPFSAWGITIYNILIEYPPQCLHTFPATTYPCVSRIETVAPHRLHCIQFCGLKAPFTRKQTRVQCRREKSV